MKKLIVKGKLRAGPPPFVVHGDLGGVGKSKDVRFYVSFFLDRAGSGGAVRACKA